MFPFFIHSFCYSDLCVLLRPRGPRCPGLNLPQESVRQYHPGLPSSSGEQEAYEPAAGEAAEEAGTACLPLHLHCKSLDQHDVTVKLPGWLKTDAIDATVLCKVIHTTA